MEIIKKNPLGEVKFRYPAKIVKTLTNGVIIEAYFNREDLPFHGITMCRGDRFLEAYYTDKWYNIYEIHNGEDDHIKGWYCNICHPADIFEDRIEFIDLAMDLLVFPDGRQLVLDEDEFELLDLNEDIKIKALESLKHLQKVFSNLKNQQDSKGLFEKGEIPL